MPKLTKADISEHQGREVTMYTPKFLKLWTLPPNYGGARWDAYYRAGFGQSRDSDALERSNFEVAKKAILEDAHGAVVVVREGHWAVGWVEWIAIHESEYIALKVADELRDRCEQHPVLDDDHFDDVESEEANEIWNNCYSVKERIAYIRDASAGEFEFRSFSDMLSCVRGNYFAGYASELCS